MALYEPKYGIIDTKIIPTLDFIHPEKNVPTQTVTPPTEPNLRRYLSSNGGGATVAAAAAKKRSGAGD